MRADAILLKAINLRAGMLVCPLYLIERSGFYRLGADPQPHGGGYVNISSEDSGRYSTPASTLYVVMADG